MKDPVAFERREISPSHDMKPNEYIGSDDKVHILTRDVAAEMVTKDTAPIFKKYGEGVANWLTVYKTVIKNIAQVKSIKPNATTEASCNFIYAVFSMCMCVTLQATPKLIKKSEDDGKELTPEVRDTSFWFIKRRELSPAFRQAIIDARTISGSNAEQDHIDMASHIARCDVYGRMHKYSDYNMLWWICQHMTMAAYWDELSAIGDEGRVTARACLRRLLANMLTPETTGTPADMILRDTVKHNSILNSSTNMLRRVMNEIRSPSNTIGGRLPVASDVPLKEALQCRYYEGMVMPYAEDLAFRQTCPKCRPYIFLAGKIGVVFHDAVDLINDIASHEPLNVYRLVAGHDELERFTRGADRLLQVLSSSQFRSTICCGKVLAHALAGSVSWYFQTYRYSMNENCTLVYPATNAPPRDDGSNMQFVLEMLDTDQRQIDVLRKVEPLCSGVGAFSEWACDGSKEKPEAEYYQNLRKMCTGTPVDHTELTAECCRAHQAISSSPIMQHDNDVPCVACCTGYESVSIAADTSMIYRFIQYTVQNGHRSLELERDN
ncbi:hypothetical protein SAMD00019534_085860 [Acytostelium subglobosum LB1]|uniref:hypothetical protein n=1 Tax=Acytostelium subglobosum LB1 TaxID=1410327 RepID=UPI0006449E1C|nr:hypothetical protein SAMD00019534_085860 [Acytostelium subglobosum LB1]GAM25411.1 hypothetical protein SAMD00019534_085860 [Acytostelium subglobosum LB1]|eukprot:XP_012751397.1 hypothetical protein SAMD00019534_085860 [Acytostelium subglobosum LB1]